jgi:biopolymer transport protein ExbB/TolQ
MRIPEYYKYRNVQILIAGMALGCIISWLVLLFIYGSLQEKQIYKIEELQAEVKSLNKDKEILIENMREININNQKKLTVEDIKIAILNVEEYKLDSLQEHEIKEIIKGDMNSLLAKNLENISANLEFIIKTIEHRDYEFDDFTYTIKVSRFTLSTTLRIDVEIVDFNRS